MYKTILVPHGGTDVGDEALKHAIFAARKGHADLSVGNIVGSNIFNIMAILGISSLISEITVSEKVLIDIGIMIGFSLVLIPIMHSGFVISRKEGVLLIAGYVGYAIFLLYRQ